MLKLQGYIPIPPHTAGEFDHGDVHLASGRVFVAHTGTNTVEVLDGERMSHAATITDCPEGSGVLCDQEDGLVFAAARGAGRLLVLDAASNTVRHELAVGPRPNGLAWDPIRKLLLVADVQENTARLIAPTASANSAQAGNMTDAAGGADAIVDLPGRPRWCIYDRPGDRFLVNIREPACVVVLVAETAELTARIPVSSAGPHGLDGDREHGRAYVACDGGRVVVLDLAAGRELGSVPIAGAPDAIWYNSQRERLYVAIEDPGVVDVIDTRALALEERIPTETGAHTTAWDGQRQRLYVFLPATCRAAVYEEV